MTATLPSRPEWARCLQAVDRDEVVVATNELRTHYAVSYLQAPQAGLSMLRMREACLGDHYNLGEIPLSTAVVEVTSDAGTHSGAAQILADDLELATAIAIADALLAADHPAADNIAQLVIAGAEAIAAEDAIRADLLQRTTVDFDLLETTDDDDE